MVKEEMQVDGESEEINNPNDNEDLVFDDSDDFSEDDEFDNDFEDDEDSEAEDELFKENPLKAIWLKLKELSE